MGQKTHPLGFRLGIIEEHKSTWYADFKNYVILLKEDDLIRKYLKNLSKANRISNILIHRNSSGDHIKLDIETGNPNLLIGKDGSSLEQLLKNIKKILPKNRKLTINVFEVNFINLNASLLGDSIVEKLEKRIAFRRAIRDTMQKAQKSNANGIKIQVSGRLNGAEIARSEWTREGRVPLQTLRAQIDYSTKEAHTIYGVLGIKIWLFKSEILVK